MVWVGLRPDPCGDYTNVANRPAPHDHRAGCRLTSPVESQRDSVSMPRVASRELPWVNRVLGGNPNGVAATCGGTEAATPLGLTVAGRFSQGSSRLATLGWRTQSRWDWGGRKGVGP